MSERIPPRANRWQRLLCNLSLLGLTAMSLLLSSDMAPQKGSSSTDNNGAREAAAQVIASEAFLNPFILNVINTGKKSVDGRSEVDIIFQLPPNPTERDDEKRYASFNPLTSVNWMGHTVMTNWVTASDKPLRGSVPFIPSYSKDGFRYIPGVKPGKGTTQQITLDPLNSDKNGTVAELEVSTEVSWYEAGHTNCEGQTIGSPNQTGYTVCRGIGFQYLGTIIKRNGSWVVDTAAPVQPAEYNVQASYIPKAA